MLKLDKIKIIKAMEKHKTKFFPKYRAFYILTKNIEDVVNKSTTIWKSIYGLSTPTISEKGEQGMKDPKKGEQEVVDTTKEALVKDSNVEGTKETIARVQDEQVSSVNPPHIDQVSQQESVQIKDVPDNSSQKINPLTEEDLKNILKNSTTIAQLCSKPILVRVDEIQNVEVASAGEQPKDTSNVPPQSTKSKEMTSFPPKHRNKDERGPIISLATLYKTMSPRRLG